MSEAAQALVAYFGYVAATMFAGLPLTPATLLAVKSAAPWAVAAVGAAAAVVVATVDYALVRGAKRMSIVERVLAHRYYPRVERAARVQPFLTTAAFAGFPLPFLLVRVIMPISGYPLARYLIAVALGRFGRLFVIATFGTFVDIPTPYLIAMIVVAVAASGGAGLVSLWRARRARAAATSEP